MSNSSGEVFYPSYETCNDGITVQCPVSATIYGYRPNLGPTILFSVIFTICVVLQIAFGIRMKGYAFLAWMFFGVALECTGWWARVALWQDVWSYGAMIASLAGLIIGPSFINGAISVTFKHIILYTGEQHSKWLRAKWFPFVFIGTDFVAIFIQAAGAGLSAGATGGVATNQSLLDVSSGILIAGVAFQLANMVLCGAYLGFVAWNYRMAKKTHTTSTAAPSPYDEAKQLDGRARFRFHFFLAGLILAYFTIIVRCAYRVPEMVDGWGGALMQDEPTFFGLEGTMLAIACISLTVAHPVFFFPPMQRVKKVGSQTTPQSSDGEVEKAPGTPLQ